MGRLLANMERANAIGEETGNPLIVQGGNWHLIFVYLNGGALERAEKAADKMYAGQNEIGPIFGTMILASIANVKIASGKLHEGNAILEQAFTDFHSEEIHSLLPWRHYS